MEKTCNRCHQTVQAEDCYCPYCGLPQLVYATDAAIPGQPEPEGWNEVVPDASSVNWKPALRAALLMGIPAGLLSSDASPAGHLGLFWMTTAAAWAVILYMRNQKPAWMTLGAGARIGLVTGLLGGWLAFGVSGGTLFVRRFFLHQSGQIDAMYSSIFASKFQQTIQQSLAGMSASDVAQAQPIFAKMIAGVLSPEGHAGVWTFSIAFTSLFLLLFAVGGGILGTRMRPRSPRPEA
jgi:hypothetical protein